MGKVFKKGIRLNVSFILELGKKKTLSNRSSYQSPVSAMKEQLPANNTNRAARMQDVETSKKREQSRKAYAQRQASPAEPSKTLGAVATKWEQQTKK